MFFLLDDWHAVPADDALNTRRRLLILLLLLPPPPLPPPSSLTHSGG